MAKLSLSIEFDPKIITRNDITDSLNEWLHGFAIDFDHGNQDFGLEPNEETGGYIGFDWHYDKATIKEGLK